MSAEEEVQMMTPEWMQTTDLVTSLTIDNIRQSEVGKALEALRDAGFEIELNVSLTALRERAQKETQK